jgi:hypothetical protein
MKKRAALCIRGAISKIGSPRYTYKNTIYTDTNKYINYKSVYNSIKKHIIDANTNYDVDIFFQSWNYDLKDELISLYKPVSHLFEDNTIYADEIENKCNRASDFGGISQALAIQKVLNLKEVYENDNNFKYDIVILFRPDVLIWTDMIFSKYDTSYFYTDGHQNNEGDIHFVMNTEHANVFKNLYLSIDNGNYHEQHLWIKRYIIEYCKFNIRSDILKPGLHEEVLRQILETSVAKRFITEEQIKSYEY